MPPATEHPPSPLLELEPELVCDQSVLLDRERDQLLLLLLLDDELE
jgi:hypothetical protein